ncbi:MAG: hypothetical protein COA43_01880 [Robiginitomaculum sp.]|nr:MAG: hypothetical protein COA43_01880 [Robiginitomaculum sp.]
MTLRRLYLSAALPALAFSLTPLAFAQVEITDARTTPIETLTANTDGTANDVTVTSTGSVTITSGAAITLNSDNTVSNAGTLTSEDADDTTGILISGTNTGSVTNSGTINMAATTPTDGLTASKDIISGSGRTGILISGASSFTGNIENTSTGSIIVRGQDSAGIRLASMSTLTGDLLQNGALSVFGERGVGVDVAGDIIGALAIGGSIRVTGEDSIGLKVSGDISEGLSATSSIASGAYVTSTGAIVTTRLSLAGRDLLHETGSVRQAGSAVQINGNINQGIHFGSLTVDDVVTSISSITMIGSAAAVLIDGEGTLIAIGRIAQITDSSHADYDASLQYAFVNQGTITANGLLDDINATTLSLTDTHLQDGINNEGTLRATIYRSGIATDATTSTPDAHARVIIIGDNAIAERINNAGTISAIGLEATDSIYVDRDSILAANTIRVTAISIEAGGSLSAINNTGIISATITGRKGEIIAIHDVSGTLTELTNSGAIIALAVNSDTLGGETTDFAITAIDVSANTTGFSLTQTAYTGTDTGRITTPSITGNIYLGSGDDSVNIAGGNINGDISFGDGADTLALSNSSTITGSISDTDGRLDIMITDNSHLDIQSSTDINITTLSVDATSTYSPYIDPTTGDTSTIIASGAVTFEDGATIAPILATVLSSATTSFTIAQAGTLNIDVAALNVERSAQTPFLYNTSFSRAANDANTLVLTLDVRSTQELGLDTPQTALFTSAFEALQDHVALGNAFVSITDQTSFNAAFNQLMPEFAGAARQFVIANVDGAVGAVGTHLNNARRSQDRTGGAWIEEFAYYADRSLAGISEQYRGHGFGITGGFDTAIGPFHTVGINLGFATTEIEDVLGVDEPFDVLTVQLGGYAGLQRGKLGIDLYAGVGYNDFEANRNVRIGDFDQSTRSDWSGTHYNASASAGYDISFGKYFVRPSATITYLNMHEKAYEETGTTGIELAIDARTIKSATASAILEFGGKFEKDRLWMAPSFRVGYRNEFINEGIITTGRFVNGTTPFTLVGQEFPTNGFILGITFAAGSQYSSFALDLDSDIRDGFTRHTARLVLRLLF